MQGSALVRDPKFQDASSRDARLAVDGSNMKGADRISIIRSWVAP